MRDRGRFITVEGSEGAGKSTNIAVVKSCLQEHDIDFYSTREPGGTPLAETLRELILEPRDEPVDAITELLMMFAARRQHVEQEIRPRLAAGQWVVCDRFTDASYAYQGGGRGVPLALIADLENWVQGELRPDLTIYLDLDPEIGRARIADREQDRLEQEKVEFFQAVRQGYLQRAASEPYYQTIDASQTLKQVQYDMRQATLDFLHQVRGE